MKLQLAQVNESNQSTGLELDENARLRVVLTHISARKLAGHEVAEVAFYAWRHLRMATELRAAWKQHSSDRPRVAEAYLCRQ